MTAEMQSPMVGLAEYLGIEERSPIRHEYVRGRLVAMAGGTIRHSQIAARIIGQLAASPCELFTSDLAVRVLQYDTVRYPDVSVVCGEPESAGDRLLLNPTVLFEVMSPSTEQTDRFEKLFEYKSIPSALEIVLISSDGRHAEIHRRDGDDWRVDYSLGVVELVCGDLDLTKL